MLKNVTGILLLFVLSTLILPASAGVISVGSSNVNASGGTGSVNITLNQAPGGLSGYNLSVTLSDPSVAEITGVTFPSWTTYTDNSSLPGKSIWIKAIDLGSGEHGNVAPGAQGVLLATITLKGYAAGSTGILSSILQMDDDEGGSLLDTSVVNGSFTVGAPVPEPPVADFNKNVSSGPAPLAVRFTDTSTGNPDAWSWDFDNDGIIDSTEQNPVHTYTLPGSYSVTLTVTNAGGNNTRLKPDFITVTSPSTRVISIIPNQLILHAGEMGSVTLIIDQLPLGLAGYDLNFSVGDPNIGFITGVVYPSWAALSNTSALPAGSGSVRISAVDLNRQVEAGATNVTLASLILTGWNAGTTPLSFSNAHLDADGGSVILVSAVNGQFTTGSGAVPLSADFSANETDGVAPLTVAFSDLSAGSPTSWSWSFGDNTTAEIKYPVHTYANGGVFTVSLTVSNGTASSSKTRTGYITVESVVQPPHAAFTADITDGQAPLGVQFSDQSTGNPSQWSWAFGDTGMSTAVSPTHVYQNPGIYTVSLTVTNSGGSDTETKAGYITVTSPPAAPVAGFFGTPTSGTSPLTVQFTDASTGSISSYAWDFTNDGTVDSTQKNPSFTYNAAGTYTVKLAVTGPGGSDNEVKTGYITVTGSGEGPFFADVVSGIAPLRVQFTETATGNPWFRLWNFGDSPLGFDGKNPVHVYESSGTFNVTLTTIDPFFHEFKRTQYIHVIARPRTDFVTNITNGFAPLTVKFTDLSTESPTSWNWDFGDGSHSTERNPVHTYSAKRSYTVRLQTSNAAGTSSMTKTDLIVIPIFP
jgi:PKD repeat protein